MFTAINVRYEDDLGDKRNHELTERSERVTNARLDDTQCTQ